MGCVLAFKGRSRGLDKRHACQSVAMPLCHQPGDLSAAVAAGVLQVAQQHATVFSAAVEVVKSAEYPADRRLQPKG